MTHTPCKQPATLLFGISAVITALLAGIWIHEYPNIWFMPAILITGTIACLAAIATIPWTTKRQIAALRKQQAAQQAAANYRAAATGGL